MSWLAGQRKWQCKSAHSKRQFNAKVNTIFEDSALGIENWLPAVWIIVNSKKGVSSCELARTLGITQKTAWFMLYRIRFAMQAGSLIKVGGNGGEAEAEDFHRLRLITNFFVEAKLCSSAWNFQDRDGLRFCFPHVCQ